MSGKRRERVAVTVRIDAEQLRKLDAIVAYRRGGAVSRAALVREAVEWMLAKEAGWLVWHEQREQQRRRREAEAARTAAERDRDRRARRADVIESAVGIATRPAPGRHAASSADRPA
jgi:Arc/MetJ-type ribon-helix-helix transcriptional regulator